MTTKAPSAVESAAPDTLESIAYAAVAGIATVEPNDRQRLGYHIWRWLSSKEGTLEGAIAESAARLSVPSATAASEILAVLKQKGVTLP